MCIFGAERPLYVRSNSKRMTTSSFVLAAVDSLGGLSFARREGSSNSDHRLESLKAFPLTSGEILLLDHVAFNYPQCVRAFGKSIEVQLLFVPSFSPGFNTIEGEISIVKRNNRSTGRIGGAFSTR